MLSPSLIAVIVFPFKTYVIFLPSEVKGSPKLLVGVVVKDNVYPLSPLGAVIPKFPVVEIDVLEFVTIKLSSSTVPFIGVPILTPSIISPVTLFFPACTSTFS